MGLGSASHRSSAVVVLPQGLYSPCVGSRLLSIMSIVYTSRDATGIQDGNAG